MMEIERESARKNESWKMCYVISTEETEGEKKIDIPLQRTNRLPT